MGNIGEEFHEGEVVPLQQPAVPDFVTIPDTPAPVEPSPVQPVTVPA